MSDEPLVRDPQAFPVNVGRRWIRSAQTKVTVVIPHKVYERRSRQSNQVYEGRLRYFTPREVTLARLVALDFKGPSCAKPGMYVISSPLAPQFYVKRPHQLLKHLTNYSRWYFFRLPTMTRGT